MTLTHVSGLTRGKVVSLTGTTLSTPTSLTGAGRRASPAENHLMWRMGDKAVAGQAPTGGHHRWFIPTDSGKEISIQAGEVRLAPHHKVRLTRIQ